MKRCFDLHYICAASWCSNMRKNSLFIQCCKIMNKIASKVSKLYTKNERSFFAKYEKSPGLHLGDSPSPSSDACTHNHAMHTWFFLAESPLMMNACLSSSCKCADSPGAWQRYLQYSVLLSLFLCSLTLFWKQVLSLSLPPCLFLTLTLFLTRCH